MATACKIQYVRVKATAIIVRVKNFTWCKKSIFWTNNKTIRMEIIEIAVAALIMARLIIFA